MKVVEFKEQTFVIGGGQPEYVSLPAHRFNDEQGRIAFCWQMTWGERVKILFTGLVWQQVLTFDKALQPQKLETNKPDMSAL